MQSRLTRFACCYATLVLCSLSGRANALAQDAEGSGWAAAAGGALGLYSGVVLGMGGSMVPCGQTHAGVGCVRIAGAASALVGLTSGIVLGATNEDEVVSAYKGAGFGLLIGSAAGFALKEIVPHYGWPDVVTAGAVGAGIGAAPVGSVIGFAAGGALGTVLWLAVPSIEFADGVSLAFVGLAVGGLAEWVVRAADAQSDGSMLQEVVIPFSISF